jgi:hypothetical protein
MPLVLNDADLAHNPEVAGSNPAPATKKCRSEARSPDGGRASECLWQRGGSRIEPDLVSSASEKCQHRIVIGRLDRRWRCVGVLFKPSCARHTRLRLLNKAAPAGRPLRSRRHGARTSPCSLINPPSIWTAGVRSRLPTLTSISPGSSSRRLAMRASERSSMPPQRVVDVSSVVRRCRRSSSRSPVMVSAGRTTGPAALGSPHRPALPGRTSARLRRGGNGATAKASRHRSTWPGRAADRPRDGSASLARHRQIQPAHRPRLGGGPGHGQKARDPRLGQTRRRQPDRGRRTRPATGPDPLTLGEVSASIRWAWRIAAIAASRSAPGASPAWFLTPGGPGQLTRAPLLVRPARAAIQLDFRAVGCTSTRGVDAQA